MAATPALARHHDHDNGYRDSHGNHYYQDRNGHAYCKRSNGTTGTIIGAVGGGQARAGEEVAVFWSKIWLFLIALAAAVHGTGAEDGADVTVVCVDVPGCEHGAILATAAGGTVVFFSMATSFPAAALGAEGLAADVTMLIGNGYAPGHARMALDLLRTEPGVMKIFTERVEA